MIVDFKTYEIIYMNQILKIILEIPELIEHTTINKLFKSDIDFKKFYNMLSTGLKKDEYYRDELYFNTYNGVEIFVKFHSVMIDEEQQHIYCVFQNPIECIGEGYLSFHELTEFLPNGILVIDQIMIENHLELVITYANSEQYKIMGMEIPSCADETKILFEKILYEEDLEWVLSEIYENIEQNNDIDVEFRMKTAIGIKWVRLHGRSRISATGQSLLYCNLKDISFRREINDKLHMERIVLNKITELSDEILFRIDLITKTIYFLGAKADFFQFDIHVDRFPESFLEKNTLHEEDISIFDEMVQNFYAGIVAPVDLRFMISEHLTQWFQIVYNFVKNSEQEPLIVVGKIVNIQDQKMLEEKARRDLLTKCYNKITTALEVDGLIQDRYETLKHAFFIIDIDNFKAINDNLGHYFGDLVLCEVSDNIKRCFRKDDIIGRIGGDEFVVVMQNCENETIIIERAEKLNKLLKKTYFGGNRSYSISGSIGISQYPSDGKTYEELYQMADRALYDSKKKGKGCYTFFNQDIVMEQHRTHTELEYIGRYNNEFIDINVVSTVFNILYETKNTQLSLKTVMQYLGIHYDVDRCYLFATIDGGKTYRNEYEWSRMSAFIEEDDILDIDEQVFCEIFAKGDEEGIFYTNQIKDIRNETAYKILEKQEVQSILLVESMKMLNERAFFGIDDCSYPRIWTQGEIRTLLHVSRIIFSFLVNNNLHIIVQEKMNLLEKVTVNLKAILDITQNIVYAIDKEYHLVYLNESILKQDTMTLLGRKCYEAIGQQEDICKNCVLNNPQNKMVAMNETLHIKHTICSQVLNREDGIDLILLKLVEDV